MARHVVARRDEIPPGTRRTVSVRGRTIGGFHPRGEFYALLDCCPHEGGRLCLSDALVKGSYVAETILVSVSEEFVAVDV